MSFCKAKQGLVALRQPRPSAVPLASHGHTSFLQPLAARTLYKYKVSGPCTGLNKKYLA